MIVSITITFLAWPARSWVGACRTFSGAGLSFSQESLTPITNWDSEASRPPPSVDCGDAPVSSIVTNPAAGELIQQLTAMVAAQTKAQSLLPIPPYSGESEQSLEDGFKRWIEQFEEHARLAGWSENLCRYHLKIRLSKTALSLKILCRCIVLQTILTGS